MRQTIAAFKATMDTEKAPHRGLYFDQLSENYNSAENHDFMKAVAGLRFPPAFERFRRLWMQGIRKVGAVCYRAKATAPVVVGRGSESITEASISLHRTYGVPIIPGSALKGLAASYARNRMDPDLWSPEGEAYKTLFGTTQEAGYVTFFDALPVVAHGHVSGDLRADVVTVHHKDYYQKQTGIPADWDSPVPVPYLTSNCDFDIALGGPEAWVYAAFEILRLALAEEGIGAKTSSGYGRLALPDIQAERAKVLDAANKDAENERKNAERATMSDLERELDLAIETGGYSDKNKFSQQTVIEDWLTRLENEFDAGAVKRFSKLIRRHYGDVLQDPDKKGGKKMKNVHSERQIKFAKRLLALEAKVKSEDVV